MDEISRALGRLFSEPPWYYLSWPAAAMILGALLGMSSPRTAAQLSVVPRTKDGLLGIFTAPFIHLNISHLAANMPTFLVLGWLVLRRDENRFLETAVTIALVQGLLLWLFGRRAAHAGMSGVIFGFFSYLIVVACYTHNFADMLIAGGVLVFFGGMLAGVAPARDGTSWEGHALGAIAGIITAYVQRTLL